MYWYLLPFFMIAFLYALTMMLFFWGWSNISLSGNSKEESKQKLTVLIALRNEESNIPGLIQALAKQDYSRANLEIILVNDHSTDNTLKSLTKECRKMSHFKAISLPEGFNGKKAALRYGHTFASGDILLLTDADCRPEPSWISTMQKACSAENKGLVLGPVVLAPALTAFQKIQQLEFMSMLMSGAGSIGLGKPILAFGPNLAIRTELYTILVDGIKDNIPSGDDMFILETAKKDPDIRIGFVKDGSAIVKSPPATNYRDFWNQRKRWVSKSGNYRDKEIIGVSILVYLMNLGVFISLLFAVFSLLPWWVFIALWIIKTVSEYPLIQQGARFFSLSGVWWRFLVTQLFYFVYIVLVLPAGMIGSYKWKNR